MFWKGKIERNTMQVFLDWFSASVESYTKKTVKKFSFYWFFEFLRHKKLSDFYHFCTSYFIYCTEAFCKFSLKTDSIYYLKSSKNTYFGPIFRGDIDFLRFWPIKLSLIISKPFWINFTVKNRSRKPYHMVLAFRAENPRKAPYYDNVHVGCLAELYPFRRAARSELVTWSSKSNFRL